MCGRNIYQLPSVHAPVWDQTHNPGMCPDWESKRQPFSVGDDAQPTKPHQLEQIMSLMSIFCDALTSWGLVGLPLPVLATS